ncbi:MAG: glycosyltransferase, partial [Candidatus Electrothrix sp. AX5]|nr:glycosyltransferase [Candidatus Electrothrix sp. AX5]
MTDSWLVKSFSGRRKKQYIIETVFQKEYDKIVVEKNLSYPSIVEHSRDDQRTAVVKHHIGKAKYIKGRPYDYTLPDHVSSGDPVAGFIRYVTPWVNWLKEHAVQSRSTPHDDEKLMLSGTLYECIPSNFLLDRKGELLLIDQEWEYNEPLELGFVLFRGLYQEFSVNMDFFQQVDLFRNTSVQSVQGVYEEIFKVFDINFDQEIVNRYIDLEVAVQLELVPYSIDRIALTEFLRKFFQEPRMKKISFGELLKSGGTDRFGLLLRQKEILDQRVAEQDESIQVLDQRVAERDESIQVLDQRVAERDESIPILNQVLADRDGTIGLLNRTVWDRDATIESLNQRVTELDNDLKYLKGLSAEYHINYLTVTGSSSWRWTALLRLAGYLARGDFDRAALAGRKIRQKIRMGPGRLADRLLEKLRLPVPPDAESDINNVALNAMIRERCRSTAESLVADPVSASLSEEFEEFPFVDISAVTFNSEKWIPDFIESLLALDYPKSSLKICFVDNGSSDATVDCLRQGVAQLTADGYVGLRPVEGSQRLHQ